MTARSPHDLTARWVEALHRSRPEVLDGNGRLAPEAEARLLQRLGRWYDRIEAARAAYDAGTLDGAGRHVAALDQVEMSDAEAHAAAGLFVGVAALLAGMAYEAWAPGRRVDLEDVLAEAWPAFVHCLASYDRENGAKLSTWVFVNARKPLFKAARGVEGLLYLDELVVIEDGEEVVWEPESHDRSLDPEAVFDDPEPEDLLHDIAGRLPFVVDDKDTAELARLLFD